MLQHLYMVPEGISDNDLLQYKGLLMKANPAFKALESLECEFNRSVIEGLNNNKIYIDSDWSAYQQNAYDIKINQICKDIGISTSLSSDGLMHWLERQIVNDGQKFTTDLKYLTDSKHLHPLYEVLLALTKASIFHKQWFIKLLPLVNKETELIEISGHWSSYTSYSGRVTATNLSLTSLPNKMKSYVVPSKEDSTIWSIDFNNAELRCVAYLSQDKQLLEDLNKSVDVHLVIGSMIEKILNQSPTNNDYRKTAKTFIFAMLYGAGNTTLSNILSKINANANVDDVVQLKRLIFERYASLEVYFEQIVKKDWVDTFYGPILPLITMSGPQKKNFAFQSMIATALKLLSITTVAQGLEIINLIHDEIWVQVPNSFKPQWQEQLKNEFKKIMLNHHPSFPMHGFWKIDKLEEKVNGKIQQKLY